MIGSSFPPVTAVFLPFCYRIHQPRGIVGEGRLRGREDESAADDVPLGIRKHPLHQRQIIEREPASRVAGRRIALLARPPRRASSPKRWPLSAAVGGHDDATARLEHAAQLA